MSDYIPFNGFIQVEQVLQEIDRSSTKLSMGAIESNRLSAVQVRVLAIDPELKVGKLEKGDQVLVRKTGNGKLVE